MPVPKPNAKPILNPAFPHGLPQLPLISEHKLREQVFTHRSFHQRPVETFVDSSEPRDYESLEHLGDSLLNFCVTDTIRKLYPDVRPGGATTIRSKIVSNENLATIATRYSFGPLMRVHASQEVLLREQGSILADMFEAYIGALYTEKGFEPTYSWLSELLTPYAREAYPIALAESGPPLALGSSGASTTVAQGGHLSKLNEWLQRVGKEPPRWEAHSASGMWKVEAWVNGEKLATGVAQSKAKAKHVAAMEALNALERKLVPPHEREEIIISDSD